MKSHINLRQLEAFRAVMLAGSFTNAANQLCVTQPAVSKLVSDLEDNLDLKLFVRSAKKVRPTQEAKIIFSSFEKIHNDLQRLLDVASMVKAKSTEVLKIACLPIYGETIAPEIVGDFLKQEKDFYCILEVETRENMLKSILSGEVDIGLSPLPFGVTTFIEVPLKKEDFVLVIPKKHKFSNEKIISLTQLKNENYIALPPSSPFRQKLDILFGSLDIKPNIIAEARTQTVIAALVAKGLGISILDGSIRNINQNSNLAFISLEPEIFWNWGLIYKKEGGGTPALKTFVSFCKKRYLENSL